MRVHECNLVGLKYLGGSDVSTPDKLTGTWDEFADLKWTVNDNIKMTCDQGRLQVGIMA